MLQFLKNSISFSMCVGIIITFLSYVDDKINGLKIPDNSGPRKILGKYLRLFIISSLVIYLMLSFYYIPKKIFKEIIDPSPAPF